MMMKKPGSGLNISRCRKEKRYGIIIFVRMTLIPDGFSAAVNVTNPTAQVVVEYEIRTIE